MTYFTVKKKMSHQDIRQVADDLQQQNHFMFYVNFASIAPKDPLVNNYQLPRLNEWRFFVFL